MLTVWSLCWGDKYSDYCVQRLKRHVGYQLSVEHEFVCITDRDIAGIKCIKPPTDLPGWWGKIGLFKPGVCTEQNIWLDLDVVITGSIDFLIPYTKEHFSAPKNWAASGHGGVQSSVMAWKGGKGCQAEWIYKYFDPKDARWPPVNDGGLWGDQEHITVLRDKGRLSVTAMDAKYIKSYKYHCRDGLPDDDCRIVVFHGSPKPSEVKNSGWYKW